MGAVYLARDPAVPRTVALKVIPRAEDESRFHPACAALRAARQAGARSAPRRNWRTRTPRLALSLSKGSLRAGYDLKFTASEAPKAPSRAVHRDIKPGNILLVAESAIEDAPPSDSAPAVPRGFIAEDRAVLADFGLAREVRAATALTISGDVLGTPLYMSPEQAGGQAHLVDARADPSTRPSASLRAG